jgi:anti-anti-sigma regulatory factor
LDKEIPHVIISAENIKQMEEEFINTLSNIKERFIEADASLVLCNLQPEVYKNLNDLDLVDFFNVTPTLSEAWDIVQMEEIERELLSGFDEETE